VENQLFSDIYSRKIGNPEQDFEMTKNYKICTYVDLDFLRKLLTTQVKCLKKPFKSYPKCNDLKNKQRRINVKNNLDFP